MPLRQFTLPYRWTCIQCDLPLFTAKCTSTEIRWPLMVGYICYVLSPGALYCPYNETLLCGRISDNSCIPSDTDTIPQTIDNMNKPYETPSIHIRTTHEKNNQQNEWTAFFTSNAQSFGVAFPYAFITHLLKLWFLRNQNMIPYFH